jgi:hypothetical protein
MHMVVQRSNVWAKLRIALLLATLLVVSAGAGTWLSKVVRGDRAIANSSSTSLYVPPEYLDFGEVWETDRFSWTLPIQNRGQTDIHITSFGGSCSCAEVSPNNVVIAPGETREVHLTLDLTPSKKWNPSDEPRVFEAEISPKFENPANLGGEWMESSRSRQERPFPS